jgi:hypothetical protein
MKARHLIIAIASFTLFAVSAEAQLQPKPKQPKVKIDCIESAGFICRQKVDPFCQRIAGACERCKYTLCGGGPWSLSSDGLREVTLRAAGKNSSRTLSSAKSAGDTATLTIPKDIKLKSGESLEFEFRFGGGKPKSVHTITLVQ